jgi:6,7-dimethyl-8-ribityllumazine synthase
MVKAIHIGRLVTRREDFEALVDFFDGLGLKQVSGGKGENHLNATFEAPLAELGINWDADAERLQAAPVGDVDLLIEVTDPDTVFELVEKRGLRVISDQSSSQGRMRLFVVELPGGSHAAIMGAYAETTPATEGGLSASGLRFGIVVSRFNAFISDRLLAGALDALHRAGPADVQVVRVPGSFEIPSAARTLAESGGVDAVICLGCLLRGDTLHYEVIAGEVARGIGQSAQETGVPHSFGVLTCDTLEQAIDRAGLKSGNKGFEAALAAVEMANLRKAGVRSQESGVGKKQAASKPRGVSRQSSAARGKPRASATHVQPVSRRTARARKRR